MQQLYSIRAATCSQSSEFGLRGQEPDFWQRTGCQERTSTEVYVHVPPWNAMLAIITAFRNKVKTSHQSQTIK